MNILSVGVSRQNKWSQTLLSFNNKEETKTSKAGDTINVLWFMQEIQDNRDQIFVDKVNDVLNRRNNKIKQLYFLYNFNYEK